MRHLFSHLLMSFVLSLVLFTILPRSEPVRAQLDSNCIGTYQGTNKDRRPEMVVLQCNIATKQYTIYVFDQEDDLTWDRSWSEVVDFTDDVWVFQTTGNGQANLIIDFLSEDGTLAAEVYDDQTGDGKVDYEISGGQVVIREGDHCTARIVAPSGWWLKEGKTNFNLDIYVDGFRQAAFGLPDVVETLGISTDGDVDFAVHVRDTDDDGRPDYEWRELDLPVPEHWGVIRSELMVNEKDDEPPITGAIIWPYLGQSQDIVKRYGESPPPISVAWEQSRIDRIGEFVASRGNENNWFVYSLNRWVPGELNRANFENPFSFYDLAADNDGVPELAIRLQYAYSNDPYFAVQSISSPFSVIRYSWDQNNDGRWDYKLDLAGPKGIDDVVAFPEFSVVTMPYERFPQWATGSGWLAATFVASEYADYISSEGIYEWSSGEATQYLLGRSLAPPNFSMIREGLRGEFNLDLHSHPYLYFSPIDHKLHLLAAERGIWAMRDGRQIIYENLNEDDYLDRWSLVDNSRTICTLITTDDYLIHGDDNSIGLVKTRITPATFTILPPRSNSDWKKLEALLKQYGSELSPGDLRALFEQFTGPFVDISKGTMRDFRLSDDGFRLIVDLAAGFHVKSEIAIDGLHALEPGAYVLTYDGIRLSLIEATPPALCLFDDDVQTVPTEPLELQVVELKFDIVNKGLQDALSVPVSLTLTGPGGQVDTITQTVDLVPGEGRTAIPFSWVPRQDGQWQVGIKFSSSGSPCSANEALAVVDVQPVAQLTLQQLLAQGIPSNLWWLRLLLFGSVALTGAIGLIIVIAHPRPRGEEES